MSASFPNSWEPYGSSQQSQALGWRKPATRPANQPTLSARWKNAHAKVLQSPAFQSTACPPASLPNPASSKTKPNKNLDLASFQQAEHEHRIIARYESVRSEVREVASAVKHLSATLEASQEQHDSASKGLQDEIVSLHGALSSVREQVRANCAHRISEESVHSIVQRLVTPLTQDMKATSTALEKLKDGCSELCKDVNYLANGLFDRIAKHVADNLDDLVNRRVIPALDHRIQKVFKDHTGTFEALMDRMERNMKKQALSHSRELLHDTFQSRLDNNAHGERYAESYERQTLFPRSDTVDHLTRSCGKHGEETRRREDHRLGSDCAKGDPLHFRHPPNVYAATRATDFDVNTRGNLPAGRRDLVPGPVEAQRSIRGTQHNNLPTLAAQDGNGTDCASGRVRILAKLRIRPKRVFKNTTAGSKDTAIDLTIANDSDDGEEANFFEDSQPQRGKSAETSRNSCTLSESQDSIASKLEPDAGTDSDAWSPSEAEAVVKTTKRVKAYQLRHKSPYMTRSVKRRRRR